ncbi:MAG: hypothetical protein WCJ33_04465, partial [Pseudomonadota bacterium]
MINLKAINIDNIKESLREVILRFPVSSFFSVLFTVIALLNKDNNKAADLLEILFFGFFGFISVALFAENNKNLAKKSYMIGGVLFAIFAGFLLYYDGGFQRGFLLFAAFLSVFIAPFLLRSNSLNLYQFCYVLSQRIIFTIIAAITLYCGLLAILLTIQSLFGLKPYGRIWLDAFIISSSLFAPFFAMYGIPKNFEDKPSELPKFLRILLANIAIPLWILYAVILYAYIAKIAFLWSLPKGVVATLIAVFVAKGITIYLIGCASNEEQSKIINWYCKNFTKIIILPILVMIIAIMRRISDYG